MVDMPPDGDNGVHNEDWLVPYKDEWETMEEASVAIALSSTAIPFHHMPDFLLKSQIINVYLSNYVEAPLKVDSIGYTLLARMRGDDSIICQTIHKAIESSIHGSIAIGDTIVVSQDEVRFQ
jgi:hypothetical protein